MISVSQFEPMAFSSDTYHPFSDFDQTELGRSQRRGTDKQPWIVPQAHCRGSEGIPPKAGSRMCVVLNPCLRVPLISSMSLELTKLDVDIVYAHRPDRLTPIEETVRAFNHVIDKGWAFYWGTSEWAADEISEACGIADRLGLIAPIVEQPQYNILERKKVEGEFQRLYPKIGITSFSPIKGGILTGKYVDSKSKPPAGSRFAESNDKFGVMMRGNYGNDEWSANSAKVAKLKVSQ